MVEVTRDLKRILKAGCGLARSSDSRALFGKACAMRGIAYDDLVVSPQACCTVWKEVARQSLGFCDDLTRLWYISNRCFELGFPLPPFSRLHPCAQPNWSRATN